MAKARNSRVSWVIISLAAIFPLSLPAYAKYGGGTGEPNDPYQIATAEDLMLLGKSPEDYDKHFILTDDIDLDPNLPGRKVFDEAVIAPDVNYVTDDRYDSDPFTGVFDGNNKKISNFNYSSMVRNRVGIFGYINAPNAEVKDLGLINPNIDAGIGCDNVGSLVGYLRNGTIINCYAQGGSISGYDGVGGLVGWSTGGTITNCYTSTNVSGNKGIGGLTGSANKITNCYATGEISGDEDVGGLVGENRFGTITDCYSSASVTGNIFVGGLVGDNQFGSIINCYSSAPTTGTYFVGGLVGDNYHGSITNCYATNKVSGDEHTGGLAGTNESGTITDCYSSASATGNNSVGGLVAHNEHGRITNCYSTGPVDGELNVGGLVGYIEGNVSASFWNTQTSGQATSTGGIGLTTAEMNDPNTFINAGWDFLGVSDDPGGIWAEPEGGGYPVVWWQLSRNFGLPAFSGGSGEPNNPYLIATADELNCIGHNHRLMDAHFKLINDIDLTGVDLFSIGADQYPFAGTFDGNGYIISNLTVTGESYLGLFGYVDGEHAHIKDLGLIDPNVYSEAGNSVGSLVGSLGNGTIINCYTQGGSVSGNARIGGLVGNNSSSIANCYSSASVSGGARIGGLVGVNSNGTITNCYAKGSVSGNYYTFGGLVGENYAGTIKNCYSVGHVQEPSVPVFSPLDVGGLIGSTSNDGTVITSFWDTQTSGQTTSVGGKPSTGGIPLKTDEMQIATIFLTVGWDFVDETANGTEDIWWINEGQDYPRLWWELIPEN